MAETEYQHVPRTESEMLNLLNDLTTPLEGNIHRDIVGSLFELILRSMVDAGYTDVQVELAKGRFKDLATRLDASDVDMRNISVDWINKNLGKLDQTFMSEEFLQQMAGTTPINAVPADGSVSTQKIVEKAVTPEKANFFTQPTRNIFNKATITNNRTYDTALKEFKVLNGLYTQDFTVTPGKSYTIKDGLGSSTLGHVFFDASGNFLASVTSTVLTPQTITAPAGAVKLVVSGNTSRLHLQQVEEDSRSSSFVPHKIIDSNLISNSGRKTGYLASLEKVVIDKENKIIRFTSTAYVFFGDEFRTVAQAGDTITYINGILGYDVSANAFISGNIVNVTENTVVIGFIYDKAEILLGKYDVLGEGGGKWIGKKGVSGGDSITWYDGRPFGASHSESGQIAVGYQSYMRQELGCEVDNLGASGQDMLAISNIIKNYTGYADTDFVTITSGANDERKGVPVGTIVAIGSNFDLTTFTGALQSSIEHVINANKKIKIFLMTPIRGWYNEYGTVNVPNTDPSVVGMMPEKYADAIKEVGKLYGIPVLDWYNDTRLNELNKNDFMGDGLSLPYYLHPTNEFYERMASPLIPFLNNN